MMTFKRIWTWFGEIASLLFFWLLLLPCEAQASFIESTLGTAVVNDATASYFNPAALVLLNNPQIIPQGTLAYFHTRFTGQTTSLATGITQSGSSSSNTNYFSPSFFLGAPTTDKITVGLAMVSNSANRNAEDNSILRYVQAKNNVQDFDVVPAIGIKLNKFLAIGAGINFSYANFNLQPIIGFPGSNIADSQSSNKSDGTGIGANAGFLVRFSKTTVIGFNYRSRTTYNLSGKSIYEGTPQVVSNHYHYKLWTPARSVFSINHFVTPKLGFIGTVQRIQWATFTNQHIYDIANVIGTTPVILNAVVPYHFRNTWVLTLGTHYRITPKWILRVAGTYNQSPANTHYQVATGDSYILGASTGYEINKIVTIDGSYAHAFMKNADINISGGRYAISGVNEGSRDAVSLKLTFNL